jgi:hypothetical protein
MVKKIILEESSQKLSSRYFCGFLSQNLIIIHPSGGHAISKASPVGLRKTGETLMF